MELLFETLVFHHSCPSYYKIYRSGDVYIGEPVPHHYYGRLVFPYFIIRKAQGKWKVEGIEEERMLDQVLRELERYLGATSLQAR